MSAQARAPRSEAWSQQRARLLMLGKLSASIVHEVKQPLTAIATNVAASLNWLSADPPNLAEARRALRGAQEAARRASAILERVRRLLLPVSNENQERCDLDAVIEDILPIVRAQFMCKSIELTTQLGAKGVQVCIAPIELQQVLLNLLFNAAEACEACPNARRRVVLRSTLEAAAAQNLLVCVEDTGTGLANTDRPRLFEALYTTKTEGLGMGLAICQSIIERHSGRIWASDNAEHGASFSFVLPVAAAATARPWSTQPRPTSGLEGTHTGS